MSAAHDEQPTGAAWTPRVIENRGHRRDTVVVQCGKDGPKQSPLNERWLTARLGAGPLSWAFLRATTVMRVTRMGEDGYIEPTGEHDSNGPATISPLTGRELSTRLSDHYDVVVEKKGPGGDITQTEEWFPAGDCSRALETPDRLPLVRPLKGVTHTPMVRADGSILTAPGYDDETGYLYLPEVQVPNVPEKPTAADVESAVTLLRGMVDQFKWDGTHDEANFLGLLLTPLLRHLCPPPYKLGAIMARQPGSGKSLLNRILRDVHGGVFRAEMPHDDAELEKAVSSILTCTTAPVVQFDNVSGTLRSSRLAGLLTTAEYSGRILGSTNNVDMVNDRLWTITGNNLNLGGDLVRRALWCTIDPGCPDPHKRTGFKLNLPQYVKANRGAILRALLILVRVWVSDGMHAEERSSDDYARWSSVVRGILANAGIPGEFDHSESAQQTVGADDEGWGEFLAVVHNLMGDRPWLVRELIDKVVAEKPGTNSYNPPPLYPELVDALPGDLHEKFLRGGGTSISRSMGMWLRNRNGRFAGTLVCEHAGEDAHAKQKTWRVRSVGGNAPSTGTGQEVPF